MIKSKNSPCSFVTGNNIICSLFFSNDVDVKTKSENCLKKGDTNKGQKFENFALD